MTGLLAWLHGSPHRHFGLPLLIAAMLAGNLMGWTIDSDNDTIWVRVLAVAQVLVLGLGILLLMGHNDPRGALCEKCVQSLPVNAPETAERKRHWLKWAHSGRRALLALAVVVFVIVDLVWLDRDSYLSDVGGLMIIVSLASVLWAERVHSMYQPWCPWCRHGGGGERTEVPDPVVPQIA